MASKFSRVLSRRFSSGAPGARPGDHGPSAAAGEKLWEKMTYFVAFPALMLGAVNIYMNAHEPERPEFIPYEHLRVMRKPFPWKDGKRGLFYNPHVNALPEGYEH